MVQEEIFPCLPSFCSRGQAGASTGTTAARASPKQVSLSHPILQHSKVHAVAGGKWDIRRSKEASGKMDITDLEGWRPAAVLC